MAGGLFATVQSAMMGAWGPFHGHTYPPSSQRLRATVGVTVEQLQYTTPKVSKAVQWPTGGGGAP